MRHKILLVDDDPNILTGLSRVLGDEPYEVLAASSGDEAIAILEDTPVDVVIADQDMPGMKGTELLSRVRAAHPDTVRFMLTGKATLDVAIQAINDGAISRFLTKPYNGVDLAVTIRQALQQKGLMAEAMELLRTVRRQSAVLRELERAHPGITRIERNEHGALLIADIPTDIDELISECRKELAGKR